MVEVGSVDATLALDSRGVVSAGLGYGPVAEEERRTNCRMGVLAWRNVLAAHVRQSHGAEAIAASSANNTKW